MDLKELQEHLDKIVMKQNHQALPDFDGYSPFEMHQILHFTFGADSPITLHKLSDSEYQQIPMLNQVKHLLKLIDQSGEMKLTKKGFLPTVVVSDLYKQGYLKDKFIEKGYSKLYKEMDSGSVHLTRILTELTGLVKKRKGKLSLTKASAKIISDNERLFRLLLSTYTKKFNWAYLDGYGDNQIGQLGFGFSLILLSKYGNKQHSESFYSEKYFNAFPALLKTIDPGYSTIEKYATGCYSLRTFENFLKHFGLIEIEEKGKMLDLVRYITKTSLFDILITCKPHQHQKQSHR